jgi:peptidoglycan/LPS O-acetylase OafA/YrhL
MYVVLYHGMEKLTRNGDLLDTPGGSAHRIVSQFGTGILGYGHYAVLVFFVLSGYVIHLRQAQYPEQRRSVKKWRWSGHYLWRRLMRIYPPLLFAILITLLFDLVGWRHFRTFYESYDHPPRLSSAIAMFLPLHSDRFGSDGPLWSIQYELLFYFFYIVILFVIVDRLVSNMLALSIGLTVVGLGLNFAYAFAHHPQPLLISALVYLPIWVSGMLLAELRCKGKTLKRPGVVAAFGTLVIVFCATFADNQAHVVPDYLWSLGIFLLMAVMMLRPPGAWMPNTLLRKLSRTSEWSYSVYLVHFPLVIFIQAAWEAHLFRLPGLILVPLVFSLGVSLGIAAWWVVERPSKWLVAHPPRFVLEPRRAPARVSTLAGD